MTTLVATFGTKFDYVVGSGDDIWVVFHDYDRVTFVQKGNVFIKMSFAVIVSSF